MLNIWRGLWLNVLNCFLAQNEPDSSRALALQRSGRLLQLKKWINLFKKNTSFHLCHQYEILRSTKNTMIFNKEKDEYSWNPNLPLHLPLLQPRYLHCFPSVVVFLIYILCHLVYFYYSKLSIFLQAEMISMTFSTFLTLDSAHYTLILF